MVTGCVQQAYISGELLSRRPPFVPQIITLAVNNSNKKTLNKHEISDTKSAASKHLWILQSSLSYNVVMRTQKCLT